MTTSRCSQLPEVLSDRLDSAHTQPSGCGGHAPDCLGPAHGEKALDEPGGWGGPGTHPQYVMQVSAKDGQLLSTVVGAFGAQR